MNYSQGNQNAEPMNLESCNSWEQVLFETSQGSVLRLIFSNIFLSDLFLILNDADFASYSDGNAFSKACDNFDTVAKTLRMLTANLFKWFKDNQMKGTQIGSIWYKVQNLQMKSKFEIHWLRE